MLGDHIMTDPHIDYIEDCENTHFYPRRCSDVMAISAILNNNNQEEDLLSNASSTPPPTPDTEIEHFIRTPADGRKARPKYDVEQADFIWYHRTDLMWPWSEVEAAFDRYYGFLRKKGGLQCKYYRVLDDAGVEKVREQVKKNDGLYGGLSVYGIVIRTNRRYSWMRADHRSYRGPLVQGRMDLNYLFAHL